mmetsp:Transcript_48794/g.118080  ORF Transcript_48794/g.118080 Transcript_48794/m.118080 type:complete len:240 (-) Transcript_48794:25-744(-)
MDGDVLFLGPSFTFTMYWHYLQLYYDKGDKREDNKSHQSLHVHRSTRNNLLDRYHHTHATIRQTSPSDTWSTQDDEDQPQKKQQQKKSSSSWATTAAGIVVVLIVVLISMLDRDSSRRRSRRQRHVVVVVVVFLIPSTSNVVDGDSECIPSSDHDDTSNENQPPPTTTEAEEEADAALRGYAYTSVIVFPLSSVFLFHLFDDHKQQNWKQQSRRHASSNGEITGCNISSRSSRSSNTRF